MRNNETIGPRSPGNDGAYAPAQHAEGPAGLLEPAQRYWNDIPLSMDSATVDKLGGPDVAIHVDTISAILSMHAQYGCPDGGAGACVYSTAFSTHYLSHMRNVGQDIKAVQGKYQGEAHWWATVNGVILDPTRSQFDDGSIISEDDHYVPEQEFPAGWATREMVTAETVRSYGYPDQGEYVAAGLFDEIDNCDRILNKQYP